MRWELSLKNVAALLSCSLLFALPAEAHPAVRGGPVSPGEGQWLQDVVTEIWNPSDKFPHGPAPQDQLPCKVEWRSHSWNEFLGKRWRIAFKVPRTDIAKWRIPAAATAAFFMDLKRHSDLHDKCGIVGYNFQIWENENSNEWFMDFNTPFTSKGEANARCAMRHFEVMWGQWTGCEYPS